ncbi:hypothetical protein PG999_001459 [Apiospora kogelbergensis]|uniref:Uncharacterized protein n=1 Tax=Apiospora kogelbergensis TaxID=1337665 RepID=A0AAW0REG8_9PEZI
MPPRWTTINSRRWNTSMEMRRRPRHNSWIKSSSLHGRAAAGVLARRRPGCWFEGGAVVARPPPGPARDCYHRGHAPPWTGRCGFVDEIAGRAYYTVNPNCETLFRVGWRIGADQ